MPEDRTDCPACGGYTPAVTLAVTKGLPCPHCDYPTPGFEVVRDARSRGVREPIVAQLVEFGRQTVRLARTVNLLEEREASATSELERERQRVDSLRAEITAIRDAQRSTVERLTRELRAATWRLDQIRAGVGGYLDAPVPASVLAGT